MLGLQHLIGRVYTGFQDLSGTKLAFVSNSPAIYYETQRDFMAVDALQGHVRFGDADETVANKRCVEVPNLLSALLEESRSALFVVRNIP
jgi:hypothetical protein